MDLGRQEGTTVATAAAPLKLNLGCGGKRLAGFVNADKYGTPDVQLDLERFPWPWPDSSVDEVQLIHVLEHLGRDPDVFIGVIRELYRVCQGGARIHVVVPHPRHDNFLGDPTHVRPVTEMVMSLFNRDLCERWQAAGYANTPLAIYHDVDLRMVEHQKVPDEPYVTLLQEGRLDPAEIAQLERERNNVISEVRMVFEVRK